MYKFAKNYAVSQNRLANNKNPPQKPCGVSGKSCFSAPPYKMLKDFMYQENRCRLRLEDVWTLL